MLLSCRIGQNYVEISIKSVKDVYDVGNFDFVTLSVTFQGTWTLLVALICTSARKLKCSPKRQFAWFIDYLHGLWSLLSFYFLIIWFSLCSFVFLQFYWLKQLIHISMNLVHGVFYIAIFSNTEQCQRACYRVARYVIVNNVTTAMLESKTKNAWKRHWQKRNGHSLNSLYLGVSNSFKDWEAWSWIITAPWPLVSLFLRFLFNLNFVLFYGCFPLEVRFCMKMTWN